VRYYLLVHEDNINCKYNNYFKNVEKPLYKRK